MSWSWDGNHQTTTGEYGGAVMSYSRSPTNFLLIRVNAKCATARVYFL